MAVEAVKLGICVHVINRIKRFRKLNIINMKYELYFCGNSSSDVASCNDFTGNGFSVLSSADRVSKFATFFLQNVY
jgi:hypothetical protein